MFDVLSLPEISFPEGFLWGSATAAYQVEGGHTNHDYYQAELDGQMKEPCGLACNSYAMYKEDIALLKRLGHQAYRFGIEWSRVETSQGEYSAEATDHYVDMARRLAEAGIRPWVTLHWFTNPLWFCKLDKWNERKNIDVFLRYVEYLVPKLAPYVAGWVPMNEYNTNGGTPPSSPDTLRRAAAFKLNMLLADAGTYDIIKSHSTAPVASPLAYIRFSPHNPEDPCDQAMTAFADWCTNGFYLHAIRTGEFVYPFTDGGHYPQIKGRADFWAVNFYVRSLVDSRKANLHGKRYLHKFMPMIDDPEFYQSEFSPDDLLANLLRLKDKPVYITENGCAADDDRFRIAYIALHLAAFRQAMDMGVDLKGYLYWSLLDNYEWGSYLPQFGLVACDRRTFVRTPKPSAFFFKEIIEANGFSGRTVRKYLDRLPSRSDGIKA